MATMSFSVPDDVKAAFDKTFAGANKNALLTQLMRQAVEERRRQRRRARAVARLLELRGQLQPIGERRITKTARSQRPLGASPRRRSG